MKLFAIYIGGTHKHANIELHDMRFIVAERIEDTYAELRRQWWGVPRSLHLDCWAAVTQADGHAVCLKPQPSLSPRKLYYVNMGGYDPRQFTELHRHLFIVAESEASARSRALKQVQGWDAPHKDNLYEAEQCFCLNDLLSPRLHVHLERNDAGDFPPFTCEYRKIGL